MVFKFCLLLQAPIFEQCLGQLYRSVGKGSTNLVGNSATNMMLSAQYPLFCLWINVCNAISTYLTCPTLKWFSRFAVARQTPVQKWPRWWNSPTSPMRLRMRMRIIRGHLSSVRKKGGFWGQRLYLICRCSQDKLLFFAASFSLKKNSSFFFSSLFQTALFVVLIIQCFPLNMAIMINLAPKI